MMNRQNRVVADLQSVPENVGLARLIAGAVAAQAGCTLPDIEEIKLVVSEAVTNAIVHGYRSEPDQTVRLEVSLEGSCLEVVVEDRGCGIADLETVRQPAVSTDPDRMGLGFCLMETYSDHLDIVTAPGKGTRIVLRRLLGSGQLASAAAT
jgi:stage II sporulation protein AB (anti-sigma F factor)